MLGKVESKKGESSDTGESTHAKKKRPSHKSPKKSTKAGKAPELQADLKSLDDKWSERVEALFLAKTFQVPVELVQKSSVVVSDTPFIPPEQQSSSQMSTTDATGQMKKAIQPVESPGALAATQPLEAPGATAEVQPTSHDVPYTVAVSGSEVQPPVPASQILPGTSGQLEVQPPGPTGQPSTTTKNRALSLTGATAPSDYPASDEEHMSDHVSSSPVEEGELSDAQSTGPDREELLDVDQEVGAEQTYS